MNQCQYIREKKYKGHRYVMWRQRCKRKTRYQFCWQHGTVTVSLPTLHQAQR